MCGSNLKRERIFVSLSFSLLSILFLSLLIAKNTGHAELSSARDKRTRVGEEAINDELEARRVVEEERREKREEKARRKRNFVA